MKKLSFGFRFVIFCTVLGAWAACLLLQQVVENMAGSMDRLLSRMIEYENNRV